MAYPVFDLHCDTADRLAWQSLPAALKSATGLEFYGPGDEREPDRCKHLDANRCHLSLEGIGGQTWTQCFACFVPDELSPEQATDFSRHVFAHLDREVERCSDRARVATRSCEIRPALEAGGLIAVRTIENARMFAADLGLVHELAEQGVLMASLSWNAEGPLASGHDVEAAGLTPLGREALRLMEEERMVLDVSHLNDTCFAEVVAAAERPFAASHSNSRAVCGHPRNLTDGQFCEIRDRGGIVGLNYCTDFLRDDAQVTPPTADDLCRHIEHWFDLGGQDTVALGSDFDGCDVPECISSAAKMPELQQLLVHRFGEPLTAKLCFDNALTFFERWGR